MSPPTEIRPGVPITTCRSCGARVFWCWTERGKRMPVDAAADPDGSLVVVMAGGRPTALRYEPGAHGRPIRRTSHFATCPHADRHRRGP
jgi:hypothetical protein